MIENRKISELTEVTTLSGDDEFVVHVNVRVKYNKQIRVMETKL